MQKGFIKETNCHLVEKINNYLRQNNFDNIFFTKCLNNDKSPYTKILNWNGIKNECEQEIVCDIPKDAKVLTKNCYGISDKDIKCFKDLGITEMEICGTDIDACCLAIGFNLFDNSIKPIFLSGLCETTSRDAHMKENALKIIVRQFGKDCVK